MPRWFNGLLAFDLPSFIGKTLATVDPAASYLPNWHIDLIAQYLQAAEEGTIQRLIINVPPRSLKSVSVSVAWPAWLLGHDPTRHILAASYSSALAVKHSIDCRSVIGARWYRRAFPEMALASDQNEKAKFMTTRRGFRMAASVGGGITGEGGNFLIIDDPMNPAQAMNAQGRAIAQRWFDHTFATRLNDKRKGVIVLVMQRLHEKDLTGHLLAKGGWEHLSLPAVAEEAKEFALGTEYKRREAGEILHPEREDGLLIERAKVELGSHAFAAQYQQAPVVEAGHMVRSEWFGRYAALPLVIEKRVQSWDTAIKSGEQHDASVCLTIGESAGHSYLMDAQVLRCEYPELKRAFRAQAERWRPQAILIEDRASGQQLLQDMHRETQLPVIAVQPKGDKVMRLAAVSPMIERGMVVLPEQARWLAEFENEVYAFPDGAHDDQVDALAQYLDWVRSASFGNPGLRPV